MDSDIIGKNVKVTKFFYNIYHNVLQGTHLKCRLGKNHMTREEGTETFGVKCAAKSCQCLNSSSW